MKSGKIQSDYFVGGAVKPAAPWTAAGSEAPRRFSTPEAATNYWMPALRPKAVSRLRLATAVQDHSDFTGHQQQLV